MTLDEARAYLRSRPMDLKAKEVLELLERMEWALKVARDAVLESFEHVKTADDQLMADARLRDIDAALTHSRLE
jgi:hypothetical protein